MLNYETLLSSYDDKLTLMQWLNKVEKALAGASASSFEVVKTGNATIRFKINFEDGTYLESGDIVLQQGESVASGEIRNGHLYLTLTNGQELDCGELFNGEVPSLQVRSLEVTGGLLVGDDANASIGGDLVVHGLTEVQNLLAYGHIETETLTAAGDEIKAEKPVVERMTGYYITQVAQANLEITPIYTGACKNGNKLTFVFFFKIKKIATDGGDKRVFNITIPSSIGAKLFPFSVSPFTNILDAKLIDLWKENDITITINERMLTRKENNTTIFVSLRENSLVIDTNYLVRYEVTFLLSENLSA